MMARKRKTLVLCVECHDRLHAGTLPDVRGLKLGGAVCSDELQARFGGGCALQAHIVQPSAMAALTKRSQQSGTESCVVYGNVPGEA